MAFASSKVLGSVAGNGGQSLACRQPQPASRRLASRPAPTTAKGEGMKPFDGFRKVGGQRGNMKRDVTDGTKRIKLPVGTIPFDSGERRGDNKNLKAIEVYNGRSGVFKQREVAGKSSPRILGRIEQLRLLSKLESAGLLSAIERGGFSLSDIEKYGLLSTTESLGLISAAADRNTPRLLFGAAAALLAAAPALVYFVPDTSTALIAGQVAAALFLVLGGTAAYGGAALLTALHK